MKLWIKYSMLAICSSYCSVIYADGLSALREFSANVNHLSGSFTQIVTNHQGTKSSRGNFAISCPQYFRWNYISPYQQVIVGDGKTVWSYDVDLKQVIKKDQAQALGASPVAILADKKAIYKAYVIKNDGSQAGIDYVLATPKQPNSGYQFIRLGFHEGMPSFMELKDSFGNHSKIQFSRLSTAPVTKMQYRFEPPKGVDVLEE